MKIRYRHNGSLFNVSWSRCKEGNILRYLTLSRNSRNSLKVGKDDRTILYFVPKYSFSRTK